MFNTLLPELRMSQKFRSRQKVIRKKKKGKQPLSTWEAFTDFSKVIIKYVINIFA